MISQRESHKQNLMFASVEGEGGEDGGDLLKNAATQLQVNFSLYSLSRNRCCTTGCRRLFRVYSEPLAAGAKYPRAVENALCSGADSRPDARLRR